MKCEVCGCESGTIMICSYKCELKYSDMLEEEE